MTSILFSDANSATWEEAAVGFDVPLGTTYVKVGLSAVEDVFNDTAPGNCPTGEFDGHYADAVELTLSSGTKLGTSQGAPALGPGGRPK